MAGRRKNPRIAAPAPGPPQLRQPAKITNCNRELPFYNRNWPITRCLLSTSRLSQSAASCGYCSMRSAEISTRPQPGQPPPRGGGQRKDRISQSDTVILPTDRRPIDPVSSSRRAPQHQRDFGRPKPIEVRFCACCHPGLAWKGLYILHIEPSQQQTSLL